MELDDLKNTWSQNDKKLTENLRLNEKLLQKLNLNNSKREMQKVLIYEFISIVIAVFVILFTISYSIYYLSYLRFSIPGFLASAVAFIYLIFGIIRTTGFLKIDYFGSPVVKVQREILALKKRTLQFRKYELILVPLLSIPLLPLLFKVVHNIDIYQNVQMLVIDTVIILGVGYPSVIWVYKYLYDKKFKNAETLLTELEEFESEK